jgi:hypothetical protein
MRVKVPSPATYCLPHVALDADVEHPLATAASSSASPAAAGGRTSISSAPYAPAVNFRAALAGTRSAAGSE